MFQLSSRKQENNETFSKPGRRRKFMLFTSASLFFLIILISFGCYLFSLKTKNPKINKIISIFFIGKLREKELKPITSNLSVYPLFLTETFLHPRLNFSFQYPSGFQIKTYNLEDNQQVITVEKDQNEGFQIFLMPYDEPTITAERIKINLPDILIENPQHFLLDKIKAISFESYEENFGKTFEVWFVYKGYLFQITSKLDFQEKLKTILTTWHTDENFFQK